MGFKWSFNLAVLATVIAAATLIVEARRVTLRPLTADEVYKILKAAGHEDAVPEGRVVTQGLAAMTGFAAGVASGVGGSILFNLASSNATTDWLNNMNFTLLSNADWLNLMNFTLLSNVDYAALFGNGTFSLEGMNFTSLFGSKGSTTNTTTSAALVSQEICFQSRSMDYGRQGRQATTTPTTGTTTGATGTGTTSPTYSSSPATGTTGTGTTGDNGSNTSTDTGTTTSDGGTGSGATCIVIQKPKARHRRRRSALRKRERQHFK